jgi:uncharacterized protein with von Willebrand factor type A (vWA) domain
MSALARNVMRFAQLLRSAGLPVGAGTAVLAAEALTLVDLRARPQVHAALRAVMVRHRDDFALFDQAFELFWRAPVETTVGPPGVEPALFTPGARRLAEAMGRSDDARRRRHELQCRRATPADGFCGDERRRHRRRQDRAAETAAAAG